MTFKRLFFILLLQFIITGCSIFREVEDEKDDENEIVEAPKAVEKDTTIILGSEQVYKFLHHLKNKKVGVVANHTSMIGQTHLVDSLLSLGVNIVRVFGPEHGFRGKADAGEVVNSDVDSKTNLPVVSLYGNNRKPTVEQMQGLDIMVFDIQDVGVRFYTYISTLHYVMEACSENDVELIILDRPNPNGDYVDGPVLEDGFKSFVGMHKVPIVHGMTVGEFAKMINGEEWLANQKRCDLKVIKLKNYTHQSYYTLPIKPSPNLPNMQSIYLYPSICLFEGTPISLGRGTDKPFQVIGHPKLKSDFSFIPQPTDGAKTPVLNGDTCYGYDLSSVAIKRELDLSYLLKVYNEYPDKSEFFKKFFNTLAGNSTLQSQIVEGKSIEEIKSSWKSGLEQFLNLRKKYLLYEDFE